MFTIYRTAAIAQLGERQTEDLKVPGSIPGRGSFYLFSKISLQKGQKDFVRRGIRTPAHIRGPEYSTWKSSTLESGALDRSAILTYKNSSSGLL